MPAKRRSLACIACRRLKTRCERQGFGGEPCRRCATLRIECSLASLPPFFSDQQRDNHNVETRTAGADEYLVQRLLFMENRLASIEESLRQPIQTSAGLQEIQSRDLREFQFELASSSNTAVNASPVLESPHGIFNPLLVDADVRIAPFQVIRDMKKHILGILPSDSSSHPQELVTKGLISQEFLETCLTGCEEVLRRWPFPDLIKADQNHSSGLLTATCALVGLHTRQSDYDADVHIQLYQYGRELLDKALLEVPMPLESILSVLMFAMWNLVPNKSLGHIDSWLLSGISMIHGILGTSFTAVAMSGRNATVDEGSLAIMRTWNLIVLCHLQFATGLGRPCLLPENYIAQCDMISHLIGHSTDDILLFAEIQLYRRLYKLMQSDTLLVVNPPWVELEAWKSEYGSLYDLPTSSSLHMAYSCAHLFLARRSLKYLSEQTSPAVRGLYDRQEVVSSLIALSNLHACRILEILIVVSDSTAFILPAFEYLLGSYAMITLSEFADHLDDPDAVFALMNKMDWCARTGGRVEPVSQWALRVMSRHIWDISLSSPMGDQGAT